MMNGHVDDGKTKFKPTFDNSEIDFEIVKIVGYRAVKEVGFQLKAGGLVIVAGRDWVIRPDVMPTRLPEQSRLGRSAIAHTTLTCAGLRLFVHRAITVRVSASLVLCVC